GAARSAPMLPGLEVVEKIVYSCLYHRFCWLFHRGAAMPGSHPSLSTDQVMAFVELARQGSLRAAAAGLHLTEQGLRNRLLALESRRGGELYRKQRGPRRGAPLTHAGRRFLP